MYDDLDSRQATKTVEEAAEPVSRRLVTALEDRQERTRGLVTIVLLALLSAVTLLPLALRAAGRLGEGDLSDYLEHVYPPLLALTGSAFGYYFGSRRAAEG